MDEQMNRMGTTTITWLKLHVSGGVPIGHGPSSSNSWVSLQDRY